MKQVRKKIVLENGMSFEGAGLGSDAAVVGNIVFNTAMVGYQEIISDPSYAGEIVVMTYPLIGQYGIIDEDSESKSSLLKGLVVRQYCDTPSNFRYTKTLLEELKDRDIPLVSEVDTRMLTSIIREYGHMKAAIVCEDTSDDEALRMIETYKEDTNWTSMASCRRRWFSRAPHHQFDVIVVDCGMKHGVVDALTERACNVTVVPFDTTAAEIDSFKADGIVFSSGPGNPSSLPQLVDLINALKGRYPIFGICLGHELIAMSYGARINRIGCGHHGNRPVRECSTGRIITSALNHNFVVDAASAQACGLTITHIDVADGSVAGLECVRDRIFSAQFHPEGCPGPQESGLFDKFINLMKEK